ncbi:Radical SAM domain protein [Labilithrix luteola]|uniref:Radical SAM domain protein n=1 Tax=Labilithrix luteola TaxID=1391654 RepID=A0A0K1QG89_9BACT|nr:arsenosugar biosynthesis radical SAM (seleno)protein ArsS [Labilithrix luteola]AKV04455.1 Radical SAM domain protein [Labilithrix luteola]
MANKSIGIWSSGSCGAQDFEGALAAYGIHALEATRVTTLQINVGKLCNMACHHCHVDAGPKRTEIMSNAVAERAMELLARSPDVSLVDITGGAPELCPSFRWLVTEARRLGRKVIDRCNLTVLFEDGMEGLPQFLAENEVAIVASLPCYGKPNVEKQRGKGAFDKSIEALRILNSLGYGQPGSRLALDLVYNPVGPFLPPPQQELEAKYHEELAREFGISFHRLLTITNMPISRFAQALLRDGRYDEYMSLLVRHFNVQNVEGLMCRSLVSVGYDGTLYDCDFNQMLELPARLPSQRMITIWDIDDFGDLERRRIVTGAHCFGCTAGAGSSCSGALT